MRTIVTDRVAWSVIVVSPVKMAEPIEIPFGLRTPVGPRNHVLYGGLEERVKGAILRGERVQPVAKYTDSLPRAVQNR